ncbi:MAG: A/G-specific adenine glycosylase [Phycisphaerae bacterium]|jgi:A/G-specific adenine glycosylase
MTGNPKSPAPDPATLAAVRRQILAWWDKGHRDMPWRQSRDPYAIWVSEIMLQQTQVATVVPYYRRFLRAFPSVDALAAAPPEAVLKAWEGLGYYSRARNLHRAAQQIIERHGGKVPQGVAALRALAGVGRYTAGAIASIAFNRPEPVLDGNVKRVLCRLLAITGDPRKPAVERRLWAIAQSLVPAKRPGDFNQAVMDLGALVCTPMGARCSACPLQRRCLARKLGIVSKLPRKVRRKPLPHYDIAAAVIWRGRKLLIDKRPNAGLLGGLWEFPGGKMHKGEKAAAAAVRESAEELGIVVRPLQAEPLISVEHAYSHFRITLHAVVCRYVRGPARAIGCQEFKWVTLGDLDRYAFPAANHRIIAALRRGQEQAL